MARRDLRSLVMPSLLVGRRAFSGDTNLLTLRLARDSLAAFFFDQLVNLACLVRRDADFDCDQLTHGVT